MADIEKTIHEITSYLESIQHEREMPEEKLLYDALSILKEYEHAAPEKLELSEETKAWLDGMTAEERLNTIAVICADWDGFRTAKGLGSLIDEILAYANYPLKVQSFGAMAGEALRKQFALMKQLEEGKMKVLIRGNIGVSDTEYGECPWCGAEVYSDVNRNYCGNCGRQVEWND